MAIHFINNYPKNNLERNIINNDGDTLHGELWVYEQFLKFEENGWVQDDSWYFKHSYELSKHPMSRKHEGEVDFLLLNKYGLLVIEVKGGGFEVVDGNFYSYNNKGDRYIAQNPFTQSREYVNSLRELIGEEDLFVYKAIVFPHEGKFQLIGPNFEGYDYCFFSKQNFESIETAYKQNEIFFNFISNLGQITRKKILNSSRPGLSRDKVNKVMWERFPELDSKNLKRIKNQLFPTQALTGSNIERINSEIIYKENYEILIGLRKNRKVVIQGVPGTGKTVLAQKFVAESFKTNQTGLFFCANKLVKKHIEHILLQEYSLSPNNIRFEIFHQNTFENIISNNPDIDYFIFDEAQEYFDNGLLDYIEDIEEKFSKPRILVLYDSEQTIKTDFYDLSFYEKYLSSEQGFSHFYFDKVYRSAQNPLIESFASEIRRSNFNKAMSNNYKTLLSHISDETELMRVISNYINIEGFTSREKIILLDSSLINDFSEFINDYYNDKIEELTENNINM